MKKIGPIVLLTLIFLTSWNVVRAQDVIITDVTTTPVTCGTGSDGTITVTISGGTGPYTYLLVRGAIPVESGGPTASQMFTFTGHDKYSNYIIIVSDSDPGNADGFAFATIGGPDPISITSAIPTDITCNGFDDGTITVTATGEGGNYIFDLTGPVVQSNETGIFAGLPQGNYSVTVSDKDGCPSTDMVSGLIINDPTVITINVDNVTDVLCFGDNTGSITITPSGGTPSGAGTGYTYDWTGPGGFSSTSEDISSLEAGDYFVTVFDGNLCSANAGPITVGQPTQINVVLDNSTDVTCNGGNDGTASITAGGGAGGYTYVWNGQTIPYLSTDEDPTDMVADTYDLTITDSDGCSRTFTSFLTITEPAPFNITIDGTTDVSCPGGTNGSASITPSGGTPPYTFSWTGDGTAYSSTDEDPVNMPADDFTLTITDSRGCNQTYPALLTITEPLPINAIVDGTTDVTCFGGNDGTASVTVSGGTTPYSFGWLGDGTAHSSSVEDPVDLIADTYDLTVTDNNGCIQIFNDLVTISQPADIAVTIDNITHVDCNGDATGEILITPSGGTPAYSYNWTGPNGFTSTQQDISGLEAGTYSLTITDANGCVKIFTNLATVNENTAITASFILTDVTCNGGSDGAIDATVSGGTPAYSYLWSTPTGSSTSEDIAAGIAGTYTLTVTDNLGCVQAFPDQVLSEPPPITASATHVDVDCFGAANGSIDLTPGGGTPPYTFAWTGPGAFSASTEDLSGLDPGQYSVTITDASGCVMPFPNLVTVTEPAEILVNSVKTDISCAGMGDGSIDITVSGGILPYSFAWTGPSGYNSTSEDISGLQAGNYSLTITDGNGCVVNFPDIETIIEPAAIVGTYQSQQDVSCNGGSDGSIEIDVSGGVLPLSFDWTNSLGATQSTDEDPAGLTAETYSLQITDANGCSISYPDMATITEPPPLTGSVTGTDVTCFGNGDGTITVTAAGGTAPYEYSRVGDIGPTYQGSNMFTSLGPGFYTVWTRDANLCVVTDTITLDEPPEIQILGETKSGQNLCFGDSSAQISIDAVTGGIPPYEYSINGGVDFYPTNVFTNLPAGNYQTVVRDATGCTASGNLNVITQPSQLRIDSYFQDDISSCFDALEGRIVITGAGGTGAKTYALDGGVPVASGDFQNLPGGPHDVRIQDANGCFRDTSVVILTPPEILVDNLTITDVTGCSGDSNGSVSISGSGGTGTIRYSMDGGSFKASGIFNGLTAGNHTITLRDDNDCTLDTSFTLTEPAPLTIDNESVSQISCAGADDGLIEIVASGGTPPLVYTLNPGAMSNGTGTFASLAPGTFTVSVDDAQGCGPVNSSPLVIGEPPALVLDSLLSMEITCNGAGDGSLGIYASGGTGPFEYSIDNQATWSSDSTYSGMGPGNYDLFVRDANLCILPAGTLILTDPPALSVTVVVTDVTPCFGDSTGSLDATANGGTGNLQYSLDGILFQDSGIYTNLAADAYTLFVRDSMGCSISEPVSINEPAPVSASVTKTDAIGQPGSIVISGASGGTSPYMYSIEGDTGTFSPDTSYTDLSAGTYTVVVRDTNGCSYTEDVDILDVLPLDVTVNATDISCFGAGDGSIEFVPQDAEGPVEFSIDSGMNYTGTSLFENLAGNITYYLFARDSAGKTFTDSVMISEPSQITFLRNITPAECNAFSETGAINITVSGGSAPYTYIWSDGSTDEDRTNLVAGTYVVQTTDANGCFRSDTINVISYVVVEADAGIDTTLCSGATIQLNGLGGHTPAWDASPFISDTTLASQETLPITQSASFVLTITEEQSNFGCYNRDTMEVTIYPELGITATEDTVLISGASIQLNATGGPFSSYRWEPDTWLSSSIVPDPFASPLESITYYVYGTNDNGCEEVDSLFIEVIENLKVYNVFSPNGDGINDYFEIENAEQFPDMLVEVYSRWGDLFFSTVGYDSGSRWDGTTRGKDVPIGTYYYIIIPYSGAKPIKGTVTIIR